MPETFTIPRLMGELVTAFLGEDELPQSRSKKNGFMSKGLVWSSV